MRIAVVGRAQVMGLGTMTRDFCRNMPVLRTLVVDHDHGPLDLSGLPNPTVVRAAELTESSFLAAIEGADVVVGFESLYHDDAVGWCRRAGIRTVVFPFWECSPRSIEQADVLLAISDVDKRTYPRAVRVEWPIDRSGLPRAAPTFPPKVFVHNVGHAGEYNSWRNGTQEVLAAAAALRDTGAFLSVNSQVPIPPEWVPKDAPVALLGEAPTVADLFVGADVMVFPVRMEGHYLPINEAGACGIPTIVPALPEWAGWPESMRVPMHGPEIVQRTRQAPYWRADVPALGELMRSLALGLVEPRLPPSPPTWDAFRMQFPYAIHA